MTAIELRTDVHQLIDTINDIDFLQTIKELIKKARQTGFADVYDTLPDYVKEDIEIALQEAERGEYVPHEEVMKQMRSKYYKQ